MAQPTKKQIAELQAVLSEAADDESLPEDVRKKAKTAAKKLSGAAKPGTAEAVDIVALITKLLPLILQILSIFRNRGGSTDPVPGPV